MKGIFLCVHGKTLRSNKISDSYPHRSGQIRAGRDDVGRRPLLRGFLVELRRRGKSVKSNIYMRHVQYLGIMALVLTVFHIVLLGFNLKF